MDTTKRTVLLLSCLILLSAGVYAFISYINEAHDQTAASKAQFVCDHGATPGDDASINKAIAACFQASDAQIAAQNEQTHELWGWEALWATLLLILYIISRWAKDRRQRRQLPRPSSYQSQ
jgi:hypothetical protein